MRTNVLSQLSDLSLRLFQSIQVSVFSKFKTKVMWDALCGFAECTCTNAMMICILRFSLLRNFVNRLKVETIQIERMKPCYDILQLILNNTYGIYLKGIFLQDYWPWINRWLGNLTFYEWGLLKCYIDNCHTHPTFCSWYFDLIFSPSCEI
jgi:hypothetical protein